MRYRAKRARLIFGARFLALLVVFYVVVAFNPVNDHVIVPFTEGITRAAAFVLRATGTDVRTDGTLVRSTRFAVDVQNGCNGIETMILFAAAVLAFPAPARARLVGLAAGLPLIQLINIARVSSLFWLGDKRPQLFDLFHVAIWQTLMALIGIAFFVLWSWKFAPRTAADSH